MSIPKINVAVILFCREERYIADGRYRIVYENL